MVLRAAKRDSSCYLVGAIVGLSEVYQHVPANTCAIRARRRAKAEPSAHQHAVTGVQGVHTAPPSSRGEHSRAAGAGRSPVMQAVPLPHAGVCAS